MLIRVLNYSSTRSNIEFLQSSNSTTNKFHPQELNKKSSLTIFFFDTFFSRHCSSLFRGVFKTWAPALHSWSTARWAKTYYSDSFEYVVHTYNYIVFTNITFKKLIKCLQFLPKTFGIFASYWFCHSFWQTAQWQKSEEFLMSSPAKLTSLAFLP